MFIYLYIFESFHSFRDSHEEDSIFHDQHPQSCTSVPNIYIFPPRVDSFFRWFRFELDGKSDNPTQRCDFKSLKKSLLMFPSADGRRKPCVPFLFDTWDFWIPHRNFWNIFLCNCVVESCDSCCCFHGNGNRRRRRRCDRVGLLICGFAANFSVLWRTVLDCESHESNFTPTSHQCCAAHEDDGICGPVFPTNTNKSSLYSLTEPCCVAVCWARFATEAIVGIQR